MFVCVWGGESGLKESLHPLTHPPRFFFLFWPNFYFFLRLAFFVAGQHRSLFLNKAGRHAEKSLWGRGVRIVSP